MARASSVAPRWRGLLVFLLLTFGLSWGPALLFQRDWSGREGPLAMELLAASLFYALTMGWQPLAAVWIVRRWVEPRGYLDQGLKRARPSFLAVATVAPLALAVAAILVAWGLHGLGLLRISESLATPTAQVGDGPSLSNAFLVTAAFVCSLLLVWGQALAEEVGWRGYFLVRLMERIGPWRGLLLHGLVWGLWYAPPLVFATQGLTRSPLRSTSFVLTCALLGALLGWLRLASRSVVPATVANAILTLSAGLPLLLQGTEVGLRGAAYAPPGWLPMAVVLAALALGRCRAAVAVPRPPGIAPGDLRHLWLWADGLLGPRRGRDDRTLH
jgi:membrane protease YdiL (CAAX protease family)